MNTDITQIDLTTLTLAVGQHEHREDGVCLLEAAAWFAGEEHSDAPACVSPVLGAYGRSLNDALPDDMRQELVPLVPLMAGTAGDGRDEERSFLALDWLIRTYLPAWLEVAGLRDEAAAVRGLSRIVDMESAGVAGPVVRSVRDAARAARGAAWDAAWAAAGTAARTAAWAAARTAARDTLQPTVTILQRGAVQLLRNMTSVGAAR